MGRPANIVKSHKITTKLPEDVVARLFLHLHSPVEGGIPRGAIARFLSERIREFFNGELVALSPSERSELLLLVKTHNSDRVFDSLMEKLS